jgi:glycosyltransferase involved in cell wall biosynthesis
MKISILIIYEDELNPSKLECPEYYNYQFVKKSAFEGNSFKLFSLLWRKHNVKVFVTIGGPIDKWIDNFGFFPYSVRKKWLHCKTLKDFRKEDIPYCLIASRSGQDRPLISVMTTTFNSGDKLNRPLESLNRQTYNNWEWIIWDDSKDDETWEQLKRLAMTDMRIRIYRAPHNGYIGEVKRRSGALAQGEWIVELDHDDHITDDLFEIILKIKKRYPNAGFIYSDFLMLSEDGENPQTFGDMAAFGYGFYFKEYIRGKFHNIYYGQTINPITASHIVGVPNHVRIWKRSVYEDIDKHNEDLPVVDDYELLLRTFLHDTEWVRIPKPCYVQYNNSGGNNFTYIRNKLIQHLSEYTWKVYWVRTWRRQNTRLADLEACCFCKS